MFLNPYKEERFYPIAVMAENFGFPSELLVSFCSTNKPTAYAPKLMVLKRTWKKISSDH